MSTRKYSGPFLKWTKEELQQLGQRTKKVMMMHNALHPRDDVDRFYESRKEGKGLVTIQGSLNASIQVQEDYIKKSTEKD